VRRLFLGDGLSGEIGLGHGLGVCFFAGIADLLQSYALMQAWPQSLLICWVLP
jgi:hypothetical protein